MRWVMGAGTGRDVCDLGCGVRGNWFVDAGCAARVVGVDCEHGVTCIYLCCLGMENARYMYVPSAKLFDIKQFLCSLEAHGLQLVLRVHSATTKGGWGRVTIA